MTDLYPSPEGFFVTTLASDLTATSSVISLTALPVRITKGYMVIEPSSATKREVIHFTSVGVSSVTTADDTTDATDATGRGCLGSVALGGVTAHDQGVTVVIAAVEQYWARTYAAFTAEHTVAGAHKSGNVLTLPQINDTSSDHQYVFAVSELAADRTVTLPLLAGDDTFVFSSFIQTMTNKTLTTPVIASIYQDAGKTKLMTLPDTASDTLAAIAATQTFINKRITPRVVTATDDATAVIDCDVTDQYQLTAIANDTEFTVTGTPTNGQKLLIRLKDAGVAKALTWTGFTAIGCTAPTTTVANKTHWIGAVYNSTTPTWNILAVALEA
jgi:hypothetical protein